MGRKGHQIHKKIIKTFESSSKMVFTYHRLYESVKKKYYPDLDKRRYDLAFVRDLNGLLNSGIVEIVGYQADKNREKKQSFDIDHVRFKLSKKFNSSEIVVLLNIAEGEDRNKAKDARYELEKLFEKKYQEYEDEEKRFYDSLLSRVKHVSATEEHNIYANAVEKIEEEAQEFYIKNRERYKRNLSPYARLGKEWMFVYADPDARPPQSHRDFVMYHEKRNMARKLQWAYSRASQNGKVWRVPDLTPEEAWRIILLKYSRKIQIIGNKFHSFNDIDDKTLDRLAHEIIGSKMEWIDITGDGTPESYLNRWKFKTRKGTPDEIFDAFNNVWFYVVVNKNRDTLKRHFAYALSDEKGSLKWFELFMIQVFNEPFSLSFQKDLGVKKPKLI